MIHAEEALLIISRERGGGQKRRTTPVLLNIRNSFCDTKLHEGVKWQESLGFAVMESRVSLLQIL